MGVEKDKKLAAQLSQLTLERNAERHMTEQFFDAIGEGSIERVRFYLQTAKDPIGMMQKKDLQGLTPLRKAMALGQPETARLLVMSGADASQKGALDKTALHEAALMGQRALLAPLLSSPNICVNAKDKFGMTPLHNAVRGRHVKAVEWLLFAGADVNLCNHVGDSPRQMVTAESDNESDRQIYSLLNDHLERLDSLDLKICCGYIGQKQINSIGADNSLVFITSDLWPVNPHFIFGVKISPLLADPSIPLRQDERFYSYVFKYRLMHSLPEGKRRVQIYCTILEEFYFSELIMKVCSKSKYLGEVPVTITNYPQQKYINFLGFCELDLQNEGQFVLVKRPRLVALVPDADDALSFFKIPLFKLGVSKTTFLPAPAGWGKARRNRAFEEYEALMERLRQSEARQAADGYEIGDTTNNSNVKIADDRTSKMKSVVVPVEEERASQSSNSEDQLQLLDWSEPDTCEDFYYISRGWTCHLEYRCSMSVDTINRKFLADIEEPIIRAVSDFYRIHHPCNNMKNECLMQIPKSPQFTKVGTVIVLQRKELGPDESEDPSPDDSKLESYLSDDGRNANGKIWLNKELKRWSFHPQGFVSRPTRIIFKANKLCTYVAIQLTTGEEKWELESDDSDSDDDGSDDDDHADGGEEEEAGAAEGEDGEESGKKKKKKKKKKKGDNGEEGAEGERREGDENASNAVPSSNGKQPREMDNNTNSVMPSTRGTKFQNEEEDVTATVNGGVAPIDEDFALGLDKSSAYDIKDGTSSENLGRSRILSKVMSIFVARQEGGQKADSFQFGPVRKEDQFDEESLQCIYQHVAANWRARNHREAKILVFTRHKGDAFFDMAVELVQLSDLTVRAESRWSDGYRMVASSLPFLTLIGQRFLIRLDGTMSIKTPVEGSSRNLVFYSIDVNELEYVVKRKALADDAGPGMGKKAKKKEDPTAISNEIDSVLEVLCFPKGCDTDAIDAAKVHIPLTGPNIWTDRHLQLRIPDNLLLDEVVTCLSKEPSFTINWWKIWILLSFDEKQVDVEKVKQDWPAISESMLRKWFLDNIDASDRGLTKLIFILDSLQLELPHLKLLNELKNYKRKIVDQVDQPRQLDLLFHWCKSTKMTGDAFRRKIKDFPTLSPLSDPFLLYLNELLNPDIFFEIGRQMDLEDNVLHSINGEENIADPRYKIFKILVRSRSKKDEVVGFTLMLSELVINLDQTEAYDFLVRETRRWMALMVDTLPDTCNKLENLLRNLNKPT